ncbi:cysteine hydrolase family protein [Longibacter sp.]|uniref:cysteine hydrolase family protein n=1 Tax=Longibacter sp. TaxID=2045415 RepID=UPI003EC14105
MHPKRTALLIIDVQQGFEDPSWGARNNQNAEKNIARLLKAWRDQDGLVVCVQHLSTEPDSPLRPGQPGVQLRAEVQPREGDLLIQKRVNSAFIGTDLQTQLEAREIGTVVIVGLTTNHCVSTTARMAANLGFGVVVVDDATAAFDHTDHRGRHFDAETIHAAALASLHDEFGAVLDTEAMLTAMRSATP